MTRSENDNASLLDELLKRERWEEFLEHRKEKSHLPPRMIKEIEDLVADDKFLHISEGLVNGTYRFSIPRKRQINKTNVGKKRDVYTYTKDETIVLKMISYLMHSYDHIFSPNLYSFRSSQGVKKALYDLVRIKGLNRMYGYKADIKNYFNSVDADILLRKLDPVLKEDRRLYGLFSDILSNPYVTFREEIIEEQKGIMAGVPLSAFLANFYLRELDGYFFEKNVIYMRYADDILVFSEDPEERDAHAKKISSFLEENGLSVNKKKEFCYGPGERFEFLGFSIENGIIDLSDNTIRKIKGKIMRASRSIRRWGAVKNVSGDAMLRTMIKKFDIKFYGKEETELSWKYWFFPTINTDSGLRTVDSYMQERLRYLVTGRYNKKNYEEVPYERLKGCGYRPLVHEYHAGRK
ncbi:MAG: reverse transcriptase domain-containing protein [Methanomassiliicoccaceae archaeon]|nr:reverse transcriptase domain-containing protein [Methanomassiliicoccaceae archaeon]